MTLSNGCKDLDKGCTGLGNEGCRAQPRGAESKLSHLCLPNIHWPGGAVDARRTAQAPLYNPRCSPIVASHSTHSSSPPFPCFCLPPVKFTRRLTSNGSAEEIQTDTYTDAENRATNTALDFRILTNSRPGAQSMDQQSPTQDSERAAARDAKRLQSLERESASKEWKAEVDRQSPEDRACDAITGTNDTVVTGDSSTGPSGTKSRKKASPPPDTSSGSNGRQ